MMMRTAFQTAAILWTCVAATQAAEFNLKLDPDLKITRGTISGQKEQALVATVPLVCDSDAGCVVEFDLAIKSAWFYAPLKVGVKSGDNASEISLHFEKRGGEDVQCTLSVLEKGKEKVIATWNNVDRAKYRLVLRWQKDGEIRFLARQGMTEVFQASYKASFPKKLDEFFIAVSNTKESGYIGYDCEEENIQMRSQAGSGSYALTAHIDFLSVKPIRQESSKGTKE